MNSLVILAFLLLILFQICLTDIISERLFNENQAEFDETVTFVVHLPNGRVVNLSGIPDASKLISAGCDKQHWAIFSHGWRESCGYDWVSDYVTQMKAARGGCIICFDYYNYSAVDPFIGNYFLLTKYFPNIVTTLTEMLTSMQANGYNFSAGYAFGFSFGAQALNYAIYRATNGNPILAQADYCEQAGVGDAHYMDINSLPDPKLAAKFVSCIHTSDLSANALECHQNWLMGYCGKHQPAASGEPSLSHHGLCTDIWNCAFSHNFPAIQNPYFCFDTEESGLIDGLRLGYPWTNTSQFGTFYALTGTENCYSSNFEFS